MFPNIADRSLGIDALNAAGILEAEAPSLTSFLLRHPNERGRVTNEFARLGIERLKRECARQDAFIECADLDLVVEGRFECLDINDLTPHDWWAFDQENGLGLTKGSCAALQARPGYHVQH